MIFYIGILHGHSTLEPLLVTIVRYKSTPKAVLDGCSVDSDEYISDGVLRLCHSGEVRCIRLDLGEQRTSFLQLLRGS